ncbi:hypothetical protein KR074_006892 [Drosophila pseudoananassae]|nr:hypothetical protein KR074_006892 [Drosophila pseudoananassae]
MNNRKPSEGHVPTAPLNLHHGSKDHGSATIGGGARADCTERYNKRAPPPPGSLLTYSGEYQDHKDSQYPTDQDSYTPPEGLVLTAPNGKKNVPLLPGIFT